MILVVDASVALKWFFHIHGNEADADRALAILAGIDKSRIQLAQPPHFIAEVAAVLAREKPADAQADLRDLLDVECWFVEDPAIYVSAVDLSIRLQHHLFDTLYHATALHTPNATFVTADQRYYEKARNIGPIMLLADLNI
ncbi:MAG: type II toxin-antitoxin system VapC family toxin [Candidatus Competibacteraceae bacterium]